MTDKQRQNGKSYLWGYHRIHVLDDIEQHLDENQKAGPIHPFHWRALPFVKQCQHEKAVDGREAAFGILSQLFDHVDILGFGNIL